MMVGKLTLETTCTCLLLQISIIFHVSFSTTLLVLFLRRSTSRFNCKHACKLYDFYYLCAEQISETDLAMEHQNSIDFLFKVRGCEKVRLGHQYR
jgi:hypothetical protein